MKKEDKHIAEGILFTDQYQPPSIEEIRAQRQQDLKDLDPGVQRLVNPHIYHVSITRTLWNLKQNMVRQYQNGQP